MIKRECFIKLKLQVYKMLKNKLKLRILVYLIQLKVYHNNYLMLDILSKDYIIKLNLINNKKMIILKKAMQFYMNIKILF